MLISFSNRWLLLLLFASTCLIVTYARRGGGGGRSSGGSRPSPSRPAPRPAPAPAPRPAPAPAPRPAPAPAPRPAPAPAPRPAPAPKPAPAPPGPSKPSDPVVVRQPGYNPNFKESNPGQGSADRQPAYNPNFKPDSGSPAGPPPPYSPAGNSGPSAPFGPPPPYQPGVQLPPYPGNPGRPPAYPGLSPSPSQPNVNQPYPVQPGQPGANQPYPVQPGYQGGYNNQPGGNRPYPVQPGYPGSYQSQPGGNRPYPVQPGYPGSYQSQPGGNRPYPVQPGYPGSYQNQQGVNRPYPVQPGFPGGYYQPGVNRPYPQQPLGGNVWQPQHGVPAPAYMNYGGIPTGSNMNTMPTKKKGFLGSLMSIGSPKPAKKNKYYGSFPSPYGAGGMGGMGPASSGFLGKHGNSAAMYTIFPYMAAKKAKKLSMPSFGYMPIYMPHTHYYHHHHYHRHHYGENLDSESAAYFDVNNDNYTGKCQQPLKRNYTEIRCNGTFKEVQCDAKCEEGYKFPKNITVVSNKCWHVTGVWRPTKNFPECEPVCENECMNGGRCTRPGVCKCPAEFRGSLCQFRKSDLLQCDILKLSKGEKVGWTCYHSKTETSCKIRCKEPSQFETPAADVYKCSPDGKWEPDSLPQCVIKDLESILL